ncbi:TniQ family protein [Aureimonas jatrophae]|uniref:TniQ family protein n=1 Tax=Aureimonas jatrophae TaxID=1166073 RepID=UPI00244EA28A|nr:TniQ family protein [Aureimonas jatrophae]
MPTSRNTGEDASSYTLRLTETHGFGSVRRFMGEAGLRRGDLSTGTGFARLARIGRCDPRGLWRESAVGRRSGVQIAGQQLHRYQWSSTVRRFCPSCFRDDVMRNRSDLSRPVMWSRVWWGVTDIMTCHVHRRLLASTCGCGRPADWSHGSVGTCPCGGSYRDRTTERVTSIVDRYIVGRLGFADPIRSSVLDDLPLSDALRAVGVFADTGTQPSSNPIARRNTAFEALSGGETEIVRHIAGIAARRGERPGAMSRFGEVHTFARDLPASSARTHLLDLMRRNVQMNVAGRSSRSKRA